MTLVIRWKNTPLTKFEDLAEFFIMALITIFIDIINTEPLLFDEHCANCKQV